MKKLTTHQRQKQAVATFKRAKPWTQVDLMLDVGGSIVGWALDLAERLLERVPHESRVRFLLQQVSELPDADRRAFNGKLPTYDVLATEDYQTKLAETITQSFLNKAMDHVGQKRQQRNADA